LEPGTVMTADTGASNGMISMTSGSGMSVTTLHSGDDVECAFH
jgi:hypothetical protein